MDQFILSNHFHILSGPKALVCQHFQRVKGKKDSYKLTKFKNNQGTKIHVTQDLLLNSFWEPENIINKTTIKSIKCTGSIMASTHGYKSEGPGLILARSPLSSSCSINECLRNPVTLGLCCRVILPTRNFRIKEP